MCRSRSVKYTKNWFVCFEEEEKWWKALHQLKVRIIIRFLFWNLEYNIYNENEVLFNFLTISWHRNIFWLYWKAWLLEDISVLAPIDIHKVLLLPWKVSGKRKHTMFHKMCSYKNNSARTWKLCLLYVYHHIKTFFWKLNILIHGLSYGIYIVCLKYGLVGDHKYTFWSNFEFTLMKQWIFHWSRDIG